MVCERQGGEVDARLKRGSKSGVHGLDEKDKPEEVLAVIMDAAKSVSK